MMKGNAMTGIDNDVVAAVSNMFDVMAQPPKELMRLLETDDDSRPAIIVTIQRANPSVRAQALAIIEQATTEARERRRGTLSRTTRPPRPL